MRWIIVGLGNPGPRYARDRHNAGFHVVDALAKELGLTLQPQHSHSLGGTARLGAAEVVLVQPQTYMNLSGEAVAPLADYYDVEDDHILVIHDELELPLGRLKFKRGGGEAGHRGLLSISEWLDTRDYPRLRFGIGRPSEPSDTISDYVLRPPSPEEEELWEAAIQQAVAMIRCCCQEGLTQAMNLWNGRDLPTPVSKKPEHTSENKQHSEEEKLL